MSLAEKLVALRKQKGLTQMELAERLNVSRQAISRWEVGAAVPNTDNLRVLGDLYGVQVDYLLNDNLEQNHQSPDPEDKNLTNYEETERRIKRKTFFVCMLAIIITIITLAFVAVTWKIEKNTYIPVNDMSTGPEDDYSEGVFIIE